MNLLLENLRRTDVGRERQGDLRLRGRRIVEIGRGLTPRRREKAIDLENHLVFPGLINCHDHLGLNLLPHLGDPPYPSVYPFGEDIYQPDRTPVREHLKVPVRDRLWWSGYKNLIAGATTVVHHDPFTRRVLHRRFPVRVLRRYGWAHSLGYGEDLEKAYAASRGRPFIIHAAEGVDEPSFEEVDRLDVLGILGPNTVLVHAVALTEAQQQRLVDIGASVIWCPASNLRLYGQTAAVDELRRRGARVGLGTDSTLSGSPTLLDEMRAGLATGLASAEEIVAMVTTEAARIFGFEDRGRLEEGLAADLLVIPDPGGPPAEALLAAKPADLALVVVAGEVRSASPKCAEALGLGAPNAVVDGEERWLYGDVGTLKRRILRAADPWVPDENPLWSEIRSADSSPNRAV